MHVKFAFVCFSIVAINAMAADANDSLSTPQTAAIGKTIGNRRIVAPMISETRAIRMPDGTLALDCNDRPNPKARALPIKTRSPQRNPNQQP